jgi:archaellum component FlaC
VDELLWESRILEEKVQEHVEWQMMTKQQLVSQIERVKATLERQQRANAELRLHLQRLDNEIEELTNMAELELQE